MQASVIESPISDLKLNAIGVDRDKMLGRITDAMRFAAEHDIHAAFFGVDSTRAEPDFYERVYVSAVEAGAKEVVVVDTLGIASPEAVAELVGKTVEWVGPGVPVHFHGHNDFGLATAAAVAAVRAGATWIQGTINGMGERAGNANLGELALTLRALYGVESNLRLDRVRDVSARVQELSGYALEPWKPVTGETLFRRESGAVASQFHDPPSIEPYSSRLVATERGIVLGKKSGLDSIRIKAEELGLDVPEETAGGGACAGEGARRAEARARRPTTSSGSSRVAEYDAVIVGSGVNSLACGALLARGGWRVCVLERNDWLGGAIHTAEMTEPGFVHDVFSAWHPLWVGGAAHALLGDDLAARGLEYLNTELPTGTAFPDGECGLPAARRARATRASSAPEWPGVLERFFPNADLAFGVLGTELWSGAGIAFGSKALRRLGRVGPRCVHGRARCRRAATGSSRRSRRSGRTALLAPWVLHTGLGPDAAASGFMTQVIAVAVQEGGMPIPRGGGAKLAEALVQLIRDRGGVCETGQDVERVLVRQGRAVGVRLAGGEIVTAERAVIANVTPTQLYERLLDESEVPAARDRGSAALPLRPRRDADPFRALRAGTLGGRRAARRDRDRPCHAGARRRLARGERGGARTAARGGDGRRRPAADDGSVARARRARGSSGSSCRSCRAC